MRQVWIVHSKKHLKTPLKTILSDWIDFKAVADFVGNLKEQIETLADKITNAQTQLWLHMKGW